MNSFFNNHRLLIWMKLLPILKFTFLSCYLFISSSKANSQIKYIPINLDSNLIIEKIDTGGVLGAGLDIQSSRIFFTIDGRYGFSFNDLGNSTVNLDVKHRSFVVLAGIGFRFSGTKD